MNKKILIIAVIAIALAGLYFWSQPKTQPRTKQTVPIVFEPKNCSYSLENETIKLVEGVFQKESAPESASKTTVKYFGNEWRGDLDGNGTEDVAFIITSDGGGSGTFYYAVVALNAANGCQGTNAILLGDRIAPQNTGFENDKIIFNYTQRKADEPMTAQPTVGTSKYLKIDNGQLVEVKP